MSWLIRRILVLISIAALATTLVSCGGGGGGSSDDAPQTQGKGTVGILLTDKPADPDDFDSMIASIVKIELLGSSNGKVTVYSGPVKEYDLLRLRNESRPLAFKDKVPAGKYCKIRLTLTDLELVLAADGSSYHPKLPGNGKLDLIVRGCFEVRDGEVITLQLDMDAGKSIHVVGNKKGYNFRPVIFVDVMTKDFESKLVRLTGTIYTVNEEKQSLVLCNALPHESMDNLGCVHVHFGKDAAYFDNIEYGGDPRAIDELLQDDKIDMELTVVGWLKSWDGGDWDGDKPVQYQPLLHMEALVAELGDFLTIEGIVTEQLGNGFVLTAAPNASVIGTLDVLYQDPLYPQQAAINGTRIISKKGELLQTSDVKNLLPAQVDGILDLDNSELKAALVILDEDGIGVEQITGTILDLGVDSLVLDPDEGQDIICGVLTTQLTVNLIEPLELMTVTITDESSLIDPGGVLSVGQTIGMNGTCDGTAYETDNVVIVDDLR